MLTAREAADRLGSSYHTIRKWITDGKITYGKHGKSIRFREWDFDALVTDGLRGENVMNNIKLAPFRAIRAFARTVISNPPLRSDYALRNRFSILRMKRGKHFGMNIPHSPCISNIQQA